MAIKPKKYIPFFESYYEAAQELSKADRLKLYDAIITYGFTGEEQELPKMPSICWKLIKPNLDKSILDWENGSKGGRPKENKPIDKTPVINPFEKKEETPVSKNEETLKEKEKEEDKGEGYGVGNGESAIADITKESMSNDIPKKAAKLKVDPFVEFAGEDKELLKQLRAFAEMRTKKHKPMTDKAKKRLCTKLDREFQPCEWMEVLEQSIYHSWDDVYELKEKNQSQNQARNTGSELDDQFARVAGMMGVDWQ